ncbi:MAG TPA: VOC family protein [Candidatus Limnocylindrales bacterium]|nr:VOC family protein [Candidatus Limnocylindrales bacterium]
MASSLSHLFFHVRDLAAARAFWAGLLELEVLVDEGGYLRLGGADGFHIGMEQWPDDQMPPPINPSGTPAGPDLEIVVGVDDVELTCKRLRVAGFPVILGPMETPWGTLHAWTRDPEGRSVSVQQPLAGA